MESEPIDWLWFGRIPKGKLTVLDGNPGLGKSTLTLDLAARVSRGAPFPMQSARREPSGVLLIGAEDGLADTVRPRLEAAGADLMEVRSYNMTDNKGDYVGLQLPSDIKALTAAVLEEPTALVVIDPLMAYLEKDAHKDQDVRKALHPLAELAQKSGAAILIVRHLNKATFGPAMSRGGGSIGIIGAARSGLIVGPDPSDPEARVLASVKCNLAGRPPAIRFRLYTAENGAAAIRWEAELDMSADELVEAPLDPQTRSQRDEAKEWLQEALSEGPVTVQELKRQARDASIAWRTLERAKAELKIKSYTTDGVGSARAWRLGGGPGRVQGHAVSKSEVPSADEP